MQLDIKWDDKSKNEHFDYHLEISGKQVFGVTMVICGTVILGKCLKTIYSNKHH
ncbi:hypothetical protein [Streptococcus tangpeifui]|uniref:hypothetical protein n=1 Tax=Streptococcus tangpeifui TaxID=2709400 RepID=UPI0013E9E0E3|nr:hypothetical protein [Streptococcus sp. ZJ373]